MRYQSLPNVFIHSIEQTSKDVVIKTWQAAATETAAALRLVGFVGLCGATLVGFTYKALKYEARLPIRMAPELYSPRRQVFIEDDVRTVPLLEHHKYD
jgi:hypothetical protein